MNSYRTVNSNEVQIFESFNVGIASDSNEVNRAYRYKLIKNKICGAVSLCLCGIVLTIVGIYWMSINRRGYLAFLLIGLLSLVPGAYGTYEVSDDCLLCTN